jgi:hypothetical protein
VVELEAILTRIFSGVRSATGCAEVLSLIGFIPRSPSTIRM